MELGQNCSFFRLRQELGTRDVLRQFEVCNECVNNGKKALLKKARQSNRDSELELRRPKYKPG